MAAIADVPGRDERDLRSAKKEWKRTKDSKAKWSYGARSLAGAQDVWESMPGKISDEYGHAKARPQRNRIITTHEELPRNINKFNRTHHHHGVMPALGLKSRISANEEMTNSDSISRSILDLLPGSTLDSLAASSDNVMYSFDRTESPGKPVTLGVYVRTATGRDMEKFVEKEFEILDGNGDVLKGRKARLNLRKAAAVPVAVSHDVEQPVVEDDGFELI